MNAVKVAILSRSFGKADDEPFRILEERGIRYELHRNNEPENTTRVAELIGDADAAILGSEVINAEVLDRCARLKLISKHGVGLDAIDLELCRERGIAVRNTPRANNEAVADLTILLMLNLLRGFRESLITTDSPDWAPGPLRQDLHQAKVGIVGFGNIGRCVARRLMGFETETRAYDPYVSPESAAGLSTQLTSLEELLAESDIVTLHAPLTTGTRNLINADAIAQMRPGALVINTARGGLMDYAALYEALRSGKLGGAGLDVYPVEPPVREPLLLLDNVVATPHIATHTKGSNRKMGVAAVQNIIDFFIKARKNTTEKENFV